MLEAAITVPNAQQEMLSKKTLSYLLERKSPHVRWQRYPKGDRIDCTTGAQCFYHCHRKHFERGEHGYLHCFIRYKRLPRSRTPTPFEDWYRYIDNPMTHLVALALDQRGQPIQLFTVNRWVTSMTRRT